MPAIRSTTFVLAVRDLKASTAYYTDVLGFRRDPIDAEGWSFLSLGSWHLRLGECPDALPASELGDHSFYAYVELDDVTTYHDAVEERGAEIVSELGDKPWGMREFGVRTVDGHRIHFGQDLEGA